MYLRTRVLEIFHCLAVSLIVQYFILLSFQLIIGRSKAALILHRPERGTRAVLNDLVKKGYLTVEKDGIPYVYRLHQHIPE